MGCIAIDTEFSRVYDNLKCLYKKSLETYRMSHVYIKFRIKTRKSWHAIKHQPTNHLTGVAS